MQVDAKPARFWWLEHVYRLKPLQVEQNNRWVLVALTRQPAHTHTHNRPVGMMPKCHSQLKCPGTSLYVRLCDYVRSVCLRETSGLCNSVRKDGVCTEVPARAACACCVCLRVCLQWLTQSQNSLENTQQPPNPPPPPPPPPNPQSRREQKQEGRFKHGHLSTKTQSWMFKRIAEMH